MINLILANALLTTVVAMGMIWAACEAVSMRNSHKAQPVRVRNRR